MFWLDRVNGRLVDRLCLLAVLVPPVVVVLAGHLLGVGRAWLALDCVAGVGAAPALSRWRPLIATLVAAPLIFALQFWGPSDVVNAATPGVLLTVFVIAVRLGATPLWSCAVGTGALIAGLQLDQVFNPLSIMLTVGPCAVGMVLASQWRLATRLAEQAEEITRERSRYTDEAVRYERARIARDLHDIVAHCVSLIVVQAGAGQRVSGDPGAELDTFDNIAAAVSQAQSEIDLLVDLLAVVPANVQRDPAGVVLIRELVERARATGMTVELEISAGLDALPASTGELVYRVVQEGLTNALKHAPGAAVSVSLHSGDSAGCTVVVRNALGAAVPGWPSLHATGGGFGIPGLTERLATAGGRLDHGSTADGGWALEAVVPNGSGAGGSASAEDAARSG